jgi:LmbE family N-acetylglucosaminyl deacetylase
MTTLVLAAHPDDEVLGCGGTIAKLAQAGHDVHVAILGEGLTSRKPGRDETDANEIEALARTTEEVGTLLGAKAVHRFALPDNRFDQLPLLDIVKLIERLIDQTRPTQIFTQHGGDLNIDHAITFRSTMTATRPMAGRPVRAVYAYEVASSSEWAFQKFKPVFEPNCFVDVSDTIDLKIQAMEHYETESRAFPHPRSPKALKAIAQKWGSTVGLHAAEAFQQVWRII